MKSIIKKVSLLIAIVIGLSAQAGEIKGVVSNTLQEPILDALIKVYQGGIYVSASSVNEEGKYSVKPLEPGYYDIIVTATDYRMRMIKNIEVSSERTSYVDVEMGDTLGEIIVSTSQDWQKPIVDVSMITSNTIDPSMIQNSSQGKGNIGEMLTSIAPDIQVNEQGQIASRGARFGTTQYVIDGDKIMDNPATASLGISGLSIITGGIPAQYGDLTGGVVIITTQDYFTGLSMKKYYESKKKMAKEEELKMKAAQEAKDKRAAEIAEEKKKEEEAKQKALDASKTPSTDVTPVEGIKIETPKK